MGENKVNSESNGKRGRQGNTSHNARSGAYGTGKRLPPDWMAGQSLDTVHVEFARLVAKNKFVPKRQRLRQKDLAEIFGIPTDTVNKWLNFWPEMQDEIVKYTKEEFTRRVPEAFKELYGIVSETSSHKKKIEVRDRLQAIKTMLAVAGEITERTEHRHTGGLFDMDISELPEDVQQAIKQLTTETEAKIAVILETAITTGENIDTEI